MIFLKLFWMFLKIGIFTFGGGYSMIALIQNEVVEKQGWMTAQEFTDILAISQMTPGPVGINTATYAGYTAVVNMGLAGGAGIAAGVAGRDTAADSCYAAGAQLSVAPQRQPAHCPSAAHAPPYGGGPHRCRCPAAAHYREFRLPRT